jgi:hypothetical protein
LARRSSAGSSNVTNTPGSPRRMPSARNCAREDRIGAARRTGDEGGPALGQAAVGDVVEPGDAGQQLGQPAVRHHAVVGARVGVGHSSASAPDPRRCRAPAGRERCRRGRRGRAAPAPARRAPPSVSR